MKYKITPLNIITGLFVLKIIWYFIQAIFGNNYDSHGWGAAFTFAPAFMFGLPFIIVDFIIQAIFQGRKYRWILLTEMILLIIVVIWNWGLIPVFFWI